MARQSCRELELIEPRAEEVRVRMLASGVCHSDLHVRDGGGIDRPRSSWATRSGVIEAVGPGVTTPRVGQLVALSWLIPCGVCRSCRRGGIWLSSSPSYRHTLLDGEMAFSGVRSYCAIGTMAEAAVVPAPPPYPSPWSGPGGGRADRLLRDDGRRGRPQDRRACRWDRRSP